jgi:uncharacterized protein YegP (UPF0339 family)
MKFVIQKDKAGLWFWKIVAANGEILCHSEQYFRKTAARKTVDLINCRMMKRLRLPIVEKYN